MLCDAQFPENNLRIFIFDYDSAEDGTIEKDLISKFILRDQCWKPYQTELMREILKPEDIFIDIGCHIGYFSVLGSISGCNVTSIDKNLNYIQFLNRTIKQNEFENIEVKTMTIDDKTKKTDIIRTTQNIKLLKISIQGEEVSCINCFLDDFSKRKIENVILEVTPKYSNQYAKTILRLVTFGYKVYDIGNSPQRELEFNTNHLENLEELYVASIVQLEAYLSILDEGQTNFLLRAPNTLTNQNANTNKEV